MQTSYGDIYDEGHIYIYITDERVHNEAVTKAHGFTVFIHQLCMNPTLPRLLSSLS